MIRTLTMQRGDSVEVHSAEKVKTPAGWELRCGGQVDSRMVPGTSQESQVTCERCRDLLGLQPLGEAAKPPLGFTLK
jgi:hypothetical protein